MKSQKADCLTRFEQATRTFQGDEAPEGVADKNTCPAAAIRANLSDRSIDYHIEVAPRMNHLIPSRILDYFESESTLERGAQPC